MDAAQLEANRQWHRDNPRRRMSLYFDTEDERTQFEAMAKAEGYGRFSKWCLDKIRLGATGQVADPRLIEILEDQIQKLEAAVNYEREAAERYRGQVDELTSDIQDYAKRFAALAEQAEARR